MWELSWYRFEVDLSDEAGGVRRDAQGDELSELIPEEQVVNAAADERGALHLGESTHDRVLPSSQRTRIASRDLLRRTRALADELYPSSRATTKTIPT